MKNEQRNYGKKCNKVGCIRSLSFGRNKIYRQINLINQLVFMKVLQNDGVAKLE
ncbi:hypothetical protein IC802_12755 [Geobacillus sp. 44C]|nr:hypothetical protein IC802_12755 [Geobacillus sp. 44C]